MDSFLQIKTLMFSFFFGMLFYYLAKYNLYLTKNMKIVSKYFITFIFIIDSALLYMYLLFKINHGIYHIYFFLMFALGFWIICLLNKKIVKLCKQLRKKFK